MATTKVSQRGQVVIPKPIRERLGLEEGQVLEVEVADGAVVMRASKQPAKLPPSDDWRRWRGILKGSGGVKDLEAEHRLEIERGR